MKIAFCVFLAFIFFKNAVCYNPYAYNPRFLPNTVSADTYSAMGDIDWGKRSQYSYYQDLLGPTFGYGSMADAAWGWKKRGDSSFEDDTEEDDISPAALKRDVYRSYKYRQPYMIARPSHDPYQAYARYGSSISRPQTRNSLGQRAYSYASMADADWGWKKRSELPALMADDVEYDEGYDQMDKRNLASLARNNFFPSRPSRNVAAMAKNNLFRKGHNLGKRFDEEGEEDEEIFVPLEEKRHISSIARNGRSAPLVWSTLMAHNADRQKPAASSTQ